MCKIFSLHCNPLQGNYRVELLDREITVVIIGRSLQSLQGMSLQSTTFFCFGYISFPVLSTLKLLLYTDRNNLVKLAIQVAQFLDLFLESTLMRGLSTETKTELNKRNVSVGYRVQGRITTQGDPCSHYREWVCTCSI